MSTSKNDTRPTAEYVKHTREELKRLQYWFAGFEAAGGKAPNRPFDPLHKAIRLLDEHVKTKG